MTGPRLTVRHRGKDFIVARRSDLAIGRIVPWCIDVDGALYQVATTEADAGRGARDFLHVGLRSTLTPRTPNFLASTRYPLMLLIDRVAVRAYPARVDEDRWPVWLFESSGRPRSECGTMTAQETVDDVIDLAKIWLRSQPAPE